MIQVCVSKPPRPPPRSDSPFPEELVTFQKLRIVHLVESSSTLRLSILDRYSLTGLVSAFPQSPSVLSTAPAGTIAIARIFSIRAPRAPIAALIQMR
jgi:hypothetical protein